MLGQIAGIGAFVLGYGLLAGFAVRRVLRERRSRLSGQTTNNAPATLASGLLGLAGGAAAGAVGLVLALLWLAVALFVVGGAVGIIVFGWHALLG